MKSGRYTVKELFSEGDIGYFCIPEIQRDYVWGEEQVRPFVERILKSMGKTHSPIPVEIPGAHRRAYALFLEQSNRYNIGFIYAYFDRAIPERFFLIDGQQRLTSLYLFLAVLAAKDMTNCTIFKSRYFRPYVSSDKQNDVVNCRDYQLKVDYKVRETSHTVLQHLVYDLAIANHPNYINDILKGNWNWYASPRPAWWQLRFENDLTVKSLFSNASLIASIINNRNSCPYALTDVFSYLEDSVEVWYFDTNLSQQGEELYVYMNSRGEQLSYNENRRAACLALCEDILEKKKYAREWDQTLQNNFWKWRDRNPSADKGLDLFLHTVEMFSMLSEENKTLEERGNAWVDFVVKGNCVDCMASTEIMDEYFLYSKAIVGYGRLLKGQIEDKMTCFLRGEWADSQQKQIDTIRIFVALEMLKGMDEPADELKMKFDNCRIFFRNLYRHAPVINSPKDNIVHFLRLARLCRDYALDILALATDVEIKNPLITPEEKWRLRLLTMRKRNYGEDDVRKVLELLDNISEPQLLRGEASILFAVAFDGDMENIINQCAQLDYDILHDKLTHAKEVFCRHFSFDALPETVRILLLYGVCYIQSWRGVRFPCDLGLYKGNWTDTWYARVKPDDFLNVNRRIVSFLRDNGKVPNSIDEIHGYFKFLQEIATSDDAGRKVFTMIWNDGWTQGRFRVNDFGIPEFKTSRSMLLYLSEELRKGAWFNGIQLNIDYGKDENGKVRIEVSIPGKEGENNGTLSIPMRQEGDWEQIELNDIIKSFRTTGTLYLPQQSSEEEIMPEKS